MRLVGLRHRGGRVGSSRGGNRPGRPGRLFHRGGQVGHALGGDPPERGRLLLRSGVVGHALGGDPPYQRGRRLLPPYAARLVAFGFLLFSSVYKTIRKLFKKTKENYRN